MSVHVCLGQVCVPVDVVLWNPWIAKAKVKYGSFCHWVNVGMD